MADRRMLSAAIAENEELNRLSQEALLLFLMTIPHLDRDGLITAHPRLLHSKVMPLRVELIDRTGELIEELLRAGLVIRYNTEKPVLFYPSFRRHQIGMHYDTEKPSRHPPPPGYHRHETGLIPDDEDEAQRLAAYFDPRSTYGNALTSPQSRDSIATTSRQRRASRSMSMSMSMPKKYDDDDDQSIQSSSPGYGKEGGPGGNHTEQWDGWTKQQLIGTLMNVGSLLALHEDFAGSLERYAATLDTQKLTAWIEWCWYYSQRTDTEHAPRSYAAVIRAHIRKAETPPLTPRQRKDLYKAAQTYKTEVTT